MQEEKEVLVELRRRFSTDNIDFKRIGRGQYMFRYHYPQRVHSQTEDP
jgi:hypothetical protein